MKNAYSILVEKPLRRARYRWEDNIRMDLRLVRYGQDESDLGERLVPGSCKHDNVPSDSMKGG
jgi:hypothetical protein